MVVANNNYLELMENFIAITIFSNNNFWVTYYIQLNQFKFRIRRVRSTVFLTTP